MLSLREAYREERHCWDWSHLPPGAEAMLMAFVFCLDLRMQGSSYEEQFGGKEGKIKPKQKREEREQ